MGLLDSIGRLERRIGTDRAGAYSAISGEPTTPHLVEVWSSLDEDARDWVQRAAFFGWLAEDPVLAAIIVDLSPRTMAYWDSAQVKQLGVLPVLAPVLFGIVSLLASRPALWVVLVGLTTMVAIGAVAPWLESRVQPAPEGEAAQSHPGQPRRGGRTRSTNPVRYWKGGYLPRAFIRHNQLRSPLTPRVR